MKMKRFLSLLLIAVMVVSLAACGNNGSSDPTTAPTSGGSNNTASTSTPTPEPELDYTYGYDTTFYSKEPVTYTMYFSDASWYPLTEQWLTEGVFAEIAKRTNVTLDVTSIDSGSYSDSIKLSINAGESKYIIPKVYDESAYVDGGAVVAVSDYVQYMPNFTHFYETYNLEADVNTIVRANGKFYRLPGMHEMAMQDYTLLFRDDIFKAAGYDISTLENDWTWEELYDILVGVKAYMVSKGLCTESSYIWSDLWCGSESGQGNGGNLLKLMGASYGVPSGWAIGNAIEFDTEKDEFYLASTSEDYKEFITMANKFVAGGILDPETFTQDDTTACNKFYRGESVLISINRGQLTTWTNGLNENLGEGNYELYYSVSPMGTKAYTAENSRLENGVMISSNALKDLGEEDFIKMMRFVDWLWYSDEAYDLIKWGVEGEHYTYVTDATTGNQVKQLTEGWYCGGLGIGQTDDSQKDLRLTYGYAGGNFWYGHTLAQVSDNFAPVIQDYCNRLTQYRKTKPLNPTYTLTEDENEQMNLWRTPLIDNINTWTLRFVVGQSNISTDWDTYVNSCTDLNSEAYLELINTAYKRSK